MCTECNRLAAAYEEAVALRLTAEAELTAATFAHDAKAVTLARGAVLDAIVKWARAEETLRRHRSSHVMRAGG